MAQRSTVHRVRIDLSDTDRQIYEQLEMSVARANSETAQRLVARLVAFCLCLQPDLRFTAGVGSGDEPDVWVVEPGGRVAMWIEVGLPDSARLLKAARHCDRVVLLSYGSRQRAWESQHLPELQAARNVTVAAFDNRFIERLATHVTRAMDWELTVSGGTLYLNTGDEQFESPLRTLIAGPPLLV